MSLIVDYSLYSLKRNSIAHAIDYSVNAAIQEIDEAESMDGLALETHNEGNTSTNNIKLNEQKAANAFFTVFEENCGIKKNVIENYLLYVIVNPTNTGLNYKINKKNTSISGSVIDPTELEAAINSAINLNYSTSDPESDTHTIYIGGNPKTNKFLKRPYFMVFVKDFQINGLFKKRTATFVGFAGAKIERRN